MTPLEVDASNVARVGASAPRVAAVRAVEPGPCVARAVGLAAPAAFGAFLDGVQRSVLLHRVGGVWPVVHATVAAVVRERDDRRMRTWRAPAVRHLLLAPGQPAVDAALEPARAALTAAGIDLVPLALGEGDAAAAHPDAWLAAARVAVSASRESAEQMLAAAWCGAETRPLYVDGGVAGMPDVARSAVAVGVVKSHRTLYLAPDDIGELARLPVGGRLPVVAVATRSRAEVATWYLRLREGTAVDPMAGVVRVEIALDGATTERADEVSGWGLAERTPVSLPDDRWRVMAYGVRDCEQYLRAITA